MKIEETVDVRNTKQHLLPLHINESSEEDSYNLYPTFPIGEEKINVGFDAIAERIRDYSQVIIDGYVGVLWEHFRSELNKSLTNLGRSVTWINMSDYLLPEDQVEEIKAPYLGGDDPVFGTRYDGDLEDFFDIGGIQDTELKSSSDICILYGSGASLLNMNAPLMYIDLPKNELQYRSKAGSATNVGRSTIQDPKMTYKEFYFIDWIILNRHKANLIKKIDWIVDEQRYENPAIIKGSDFRSSLDKMSTSAFRVRPWFEPGVWGGQWCKKHINELPQNVPNYAWSFEMIVPENGLIFSSGNENLEVTFDWLMYRNHESILGDSADKFGYDFPIRFDFLDTFDGGNLSLQCHPRSEYIRDHFGEPFTQDETYYILDCKPDAEVYLGFCEDIYPDKFREELEVGAKDGTKVEVKDYVLTHEAQKHDLFLIPSGTIHCSGVNNMVLEISATPYIFTFKMYDWQRLDLEGNPRPINISRAFDNLQFDRKGKEKIQKEFISTPYVLESGEDWQLVHLPTHPEHFYDVHRFDFVNEIQAETNGSCHVMSLVEGNSIIVKTANGARQQFNFAETFIIPAAAESYRLINKSDGMARVVKAFVK